MKLNYFILIICFVCTQTSIIKSQTVTPEVNGSIYSFSFNNLELLIDAEEGAKVSSFKINGSEFLVTSSGDGDYLYGSTAWPAPQSEFGWPPPMELDAGSYTGSIDGNVITLTSPIDVDGNENEMQFTKSFWADNADTSITINYSLINKGSSQITKAVWELTRPPVNGITFWPTGPAGTWGDLASSVVEQNNYSWIDIGNESRSDLKFFADGSQGWFAHVDSDNRLFVKTFDDVNQADFANGEAEIELWIAGNYIELENIGAAGTLNTDEKVDYKVKWYLRELPSNIIASIGNQDLVNYVNNIVGGATGINPENEFDKITAYPNPTKSTVTFNLDSKNAANINLKIMDMLGTEHLSTNMVNSKTIDLSHLPSGIYVYVISSNKITEKGKIIKE